MEYVPADVDGTSMRKYVGILMLSWEFAMHIFARMGFDEVTKKWKEMRKKLSISIRV